LDEVNELVAKVASRLGIGSEVYPIGVLYLLEAVIEEPGKVCFLF